MSDVVSDEEFLLELLRKDGCYLENSHFKLVSGKHSDSYLQIRIGLMNSQICSEFAKRMVLKLSVIKPTALAASTIGGILLADAVAKALKIPALIGRQENTTINWVNVSALDPKSLDNVVLVDDVLTTWGTLLPAIQSLKQLNVGIIAVVVAVDRSEKGGNEVTIDEVQYKLFRLISLSLKLWDPSDCPICPKPYIDLHDPEQNFLSVILSMPPQKADVIINGYRRVYELQRDDEQVEMIDRWKPWLPSLLAGLPVGRVGEDSGLVQFIRRICREESDVKRRRVLTELVGHLLAVSNIKVEARSVGCSILVGDTSKLLNFLQIKVPVEAPIGIKSSSFSELIPYYDALPETEAVFIFDRDGNLAAVRQLVRPTESGETRGIQLLRQVTHQCDALGLVLRRGRKAISVYQRGRLEAIAQLSEKTGFWEFMTPISTIKEVVSLIPNIDQTLETVLEISREMVDRGYGGILVIGTLSPSLRYKPPKIKLESVPLASLGIRLATEIAKLDGAMFVSKDGEVREASVIIVNTLAKDISSDESSSGFSKIGGSRRETAYRTSLECPDAAVVCVSQNGTIEIFVRGQSWPVSEALTGVSR